VEAGFPFNTRKVRKKKEKEGKRKKRIQKQEVRTKNKDLTLRTAGTRASELSARWTV
jgi:hypothetical protein